MTGLTTDVGIKLRLFVEDRDPHGMPLHVDVAGVLRPDPGIGRSRNGFTLEDGMEVVLWHYRRNGRAVQWQVRQRVAPSLYRVGWVRLVDEMIVHPDSLEARCRRAMAEATSLWWAPAWDADRG